MIFFPKTQPTGSFYPKLRQTTQFISFYDPKTTKNPNFWEHFVKKKRSFSYKNSRMLLNANINFQKLKELI